MRLNRKKFQQMMDEKKLSSGQVQRLTGLSEKTFGWIMQHGFVEPCTMECLADAVGCQMREITAPEITGRNENVIEFVKDSKRATVTFCQGRYKSRIKKLAAERPEECEIVAENQDGSLCAHIPVAWIKINPTHQLTEEQRKEIAERFKRK